MESARQSRTRYTARDLAVIAGWQVLLIGGLTLAIGWWGYFVVWLLPVYLFMYLGDLLRSFLEHAHLEDDAAADAHRLSDLQEQSVGTHRSSRQ